MVKVMSLMLALAVLAVTASSARAMVASNQESCQKDADKKYVRAITRAGTTYGVDTAKCLVLPASTDDVDAQQTRPSCPQACQFGLCLARCYIDRISLYPGGCKVTDCLPGCTASVNYKCGNTCNLG